MACKFDALTDMEELHIQKSSDLPNNNLIFRFELHIGYEVATERPNVPKDSSAKSSSKGKAPRPL